MRCKVAATIFFSFVVFSGFPVFEPTGQVRAQERPATAEVQAYLHPIRKFVAAVPAGAELVERGKSVEVLIRSSQGYIIKIQTGDTNPALSLAQMIAKLEAVTLGTGKPWSQKLGERSSKIAGLDAIESLYEGGGTRAKVVIARGVKTDFVIIFFAPVDSYEKLNRDFEWFLANFQPNPADIPVVEKAPAAGNTPAARNALPPAKPVVPSGPPKRFEATGYGYAIEYPGNWDVNRPSEDTASFSGKKGTQAFQVVVSIQNVRPATAKTPGQAADWALADLKTSLAREAADFKIVGEKPLTYQNGNLSLSGRQIVVTYSYSGERYRRWVLVLPRPTGTVAHIWSYTAPDSLFVEFRPFADAMLKSWTIQPGGG
jgi:hypothetical protein